MKEEEEFKEMHFAVDIPSDDGEEWVNVKDFETEEEAIEFAQAVFGADEKGRVCLISKF